VIDAGMMFPGNEHLGVEVVIPNLDFLDACGTIHAVVLSHGHEDHIGALPFLLARHAVPVYGTPYTLGLCRARLEEHSLASRPTLREIAPGGDVLSVGPFTIEALPVAHSIPQSLLLVLRTPVGVIVHTADFKLDPTPPDGVGLDLGRLSRLGDEGVLALLSDSTNAEVEGFTPSERTIVPALESLLLGARGRVLVTTFSSNIQRMQIVADLAAKHGRQVAVVGSSMAVQSDVAEKLGLLRYAPGTRVDAATAMELAPQRSLLLVTGSQGEPLSALARISVNRHREVLIADGDLVIHSARAIPGNEKSIGRMINHLLRRGADVVTAADHPVHVSGHPARDELRLLLQLLRPKFLIPIHGEYRQLRAHARLGQEAGLPAEQVRLIESGDVLAVNANACSLVDRVTVGQVFIDAVLSEVDVDVLRERKQVAWDGIVVPVVAVHRDSGAVSGTPEIVTRGLPLEPDDGELMADAARIVADSLAEASPEERSDEGVLKARIQGDLRRFLRRRIQRRPLIIPVIVEF
jgi:ribonuclease J